MRSLAVLRHAKSSWKSSGIDDFDRPLNARGRRAAKAVGRELESRMPVFDAVLASPAARVRETLERLQITYGELPNLRFEPDLYLADLSILVHCVRLLDDEFGRVLLVGHNPGLHQLVLELSSRDDRSRGQVRDKFPTGAAALLELPAARWREIEPGTAAIRGLIFPRDLD